MAKKVPCPKCGKSFTLPGLSGHLRFAHGVDSKEAKDALAVAEASGEEVVEDEQERVFAIMDLLEEVRSRKAIIRRLRKKRAWDEEEEEEEEEEGVLGWLFGDGSLEEEWDEKDEGDEDERDGTDEEDEGDEDDEEGQSFLCRETIDAAWGALKKAEKELLRELAELGALKAGEEK